jgi:hypothetical protein
MDATQRRMDFCTKEFSGLDTLDGCNTCLPDLE